MILKTKRFKSDVVVQAFYKESMIGLAKEDARFSVVRRLQDAFRVRLDLIKFNADSPSANLIHFTQSYGPSLFALSFGLEEASANRWGVQTGEQIVDLYGGMFKIIEEIPLRAVRVNLARHFTTEGDLESYLRSLNPQIPEGFKPLLTGQGAFYNLDIKNQNLKIFITVVKSLLAEKGLFLGIDYQFEPFTLDFNGVLKVLAEQTDFIQRELMLELEKEV